MLQKMENALCKAYLKARLELLKLKEEENGMETLEVVILVAVAVIVAGLIINALSGPDGLVKDIFGQITEKIRELFGNVSNSTT